MPVVDDERHDAAAEALLEQDQPSDAAIAILKRVDTLECNVKVQQLIQRLLRGPVVLYKQLLHRRSAPDRRGSGLPADLVRKSLVCSDREPAQTAVRFRAYLPRYLLSPFVSAEYRAISLSSMAYSNNLR